MNNLTRAAHQLQQHGCCVLPARADGSKAPTAAWKTYAYLQQRPPDKQQLTEWLQTGQHDGIGIVTGAASGNLEMIEFEGRAVQENLVQKTWQTFQDHQAGELWQRITTGYSEATPSGGLHIYIRVTGCPVQPNTVLAARPPTETELADDPNCKRKILIETRGQYGYSVTSPSGGRTHPSGKSWQTITGNPARIPTLTAEEYELAHLLFGLHNETPPPETFKQPTPEPQPKQRTPGQILPGEDYATKHTWNQLLTEAGWTLVRQVNNGETYWRRPGKPPGTGISATTGRAGLDNLYVFSTSAGLPVEEPISKLHFYAHTHHGGNMSEAVKQLDAQGYGNTGQANARIMKLLPRPKTEGNTALAANPTTQPDNENSTETTLTDTGNAQLLADRYHNTIYYDAPNKTWAVWEGNKWETDERGHIQELAKETIHAINPTNKEEQKHKARSLSRTSITDMIRLAASIPHIAKLPKDLNPNPDLLNHSGEGGAGETNLTTGTHQPSNPHHYHTKSTPFPPRNMPTPRWDQFLTDTFQNDPELIGYVRRLAGYSASGRQDFHVLPFCYGSGQNGKTVFLEVLAGILGDYATSAPMGFLMTGKPAHETEIARLQGTRFVICPEVNQRDRFDEAKIKMLSGGDQLTARYLNKDHFTFTPTHHLWLMGNHMPRVDAGGESFWRRLRLIPFLNTVPTEKQIPGLQNLLIEEEGPGILKWVIDGSEEVFNKGGLRDPEKVLEVTRQYAEEEDAITKFCEDVCLFSPTLRADTIKVRAAYTLWCKRNGERVLNPQQFSREIKARHPVKVAKSHGHRYFEGMDILPEHEAAEPE